MGGAYNMNGNTCRLLVGKPEGKRPLGRPRHGPWIARMGWCGLD
jgi:hypothetical protein